MFRKAVHLSLTSSGSARCNFCGSLNGSLVMIFLEYNITESCWCCVASSYSDFARKHLLALSLNFPAAFGSSFNYWEMSNCAIYNSQIFDNKLVQFTNCYLIDNGQEIKDNLMVLNQRVVDGQNIFYKEKRTADITIDCKGCMLCPGFIDLQINGGYGVDFSDVSVDITAAVQLVAKNLVKTGVTAFCPTIISSSRDTYRKVFCFKCANFL
ncbi:hypothetical protein GJ496_011480 [Pomphorhynchus laevis]|nr:hypothetical protein GJ496_011480 [Pomphorhynchus laevis]